jgi:hypothetical protein
MGGTRFKVVAAAALVGALVLSGCSDNTHGATSTLKLVEPGGNAGSFGPIGRVSGKTIKPGNGFAFSTPLQEPSSKKIVGELDATCIATLPSTGNTLHGQCNGTALLSGGSLALNVGGNTTNNVSGSITGGTGKYAGATGTFSSLGKNAKNDTFNITLP